MVKMIKVEVRIQVASSHVETAGLSPPVQLPSLNVKLANEGLMLELYDIADFSTSQNGKTFPRE